MTSKDAKRPQKALMRPNEIKYVPNNAKCVSNNVKCVTKYAKALMNGVKSAGGVQMRSKQSQNAFQAEQKLCTVSDLLRSNVFEWTSKLLNGIKQHPDQIRPDFRQKT